MTDLDGLAWPVERLADALVALGAEAGLGPGAVHPPALPDTVAADTPTLARWVEAVARSAGLVAEPVETTYAEVDRFLRAGGPALVRIGARGGVLALVESRRARAVLLGPDRECQEVPLTAVRAALVRELEAPHDADVDRFLAEVGVSDADGPRARRVLLAERLAGAFVGGPAWLLRLPDGAAPARRLRRTRLPARLAALLATHTAEYALWLLAWGLLGRAVLAGRMDHGWLLAWALLLVTLVPLRALGTWLAGVVTVQAGGLLRRRLLAGALRLEPEEIRHQGIGQLLGRVLEADAIDALALGGGLAAVTAAIELIVVGALLLATGLGLLAALLVGWTAAVLALGRRWVPQRAAWTAQRLALTHDLVERMVGHRTRQAQEATGRWHDAEDQALDAYLGLSRRMDTGLVLLEVAASRGWLVVGLAGVGFEFIAGIPPERLALALGAMLLASRALRRVAAGLSQLAGAAIAWRQIAPLLRAAGGPVAEGALAQAVVLGSGSGNGRPLVEAQDLVFRHPGREEPVLQGVSLTVQPGERILLQGASGAGKSTLAALLVGLRAPQGGLLLLDGFDRQTLGTDAWRRRVVAAPQFHENHVLSATFLFNALMGTDRWPPRRRDFEEVEVVCRELGLGELLARMPAGLLQMVGETGWQLSHGERSRLYIARALLQRAELVVLDESFGALDPENMERALRCVLGRARTLVVIAHP